MATPNSIPVCQSSRMHGHSYLHTRLPILHSHRFHHSHANSASCTWPLMSRSISLHPYTHLSVPTSLTHHLSIPSKLTKPSHLATLHPSHPNHPKPIYHGAEVTTVTSSGYCQLAAVASLSIASLVVEAPWLKATPKWKTSFVGD